MLAEELGEELEVVLSLSNRMGVVWKDCARLFTGAAALDF